MGYSSSLGSFLNNRLTDFTQQEIAAQLEFHGPSGNATVIHDESSKVELRIIFQYHGSQQQRAEGGIVLVNFPSSFCGSEEER